MNWKRHTLVDISDAGREAILSELTGENHLLRESIGDILLSERAGARIPGIVRREELTPRSGCLAVGFCAPITGKDGRMRVAAFVAPEDVAQATTPYELLSLSIPLRTTATRALCATAELAGTLGIGLGVWGSAALELYTGLPYTYEESDLDVLVKGAPQETLSRFLDAVRIIEERLGLRIDAEVDLPDGYGIQLKELLGQSAMVLGKSIDGVRLFPRYHILAALPH